MKTNKEVISKIREGKGWYYMYAEGSTFYIPNVLHIERNDELMKFEDDSEASKAAEKAGVPLIYNMDGVPDGVYVDTEENRRIIEEMLNLYPEYREVADKANLTNSQNQMPVSVRETETVLKLLMCMEMDGEDNYACMDNPGQLAYEWRELIEKNGIGIINDKFEAYYPDVKIEEYYSDMKI